MKGSPCFSMVGFAKTTENTKKRTVMKTNSTFSLSMQNEISFDSELNRAFNELQLKTLLNRSGIIKQKNAGNLIVNTGNIHGLPLA